MTNAGALRDRSRANGSGPLAIGLVNNMPDAALRSTERQFRELLDGAAGGRAIELRVFSLHDLPRSAAARQYVRDYHEGIDALWHAELDGLIVTGTEPRAADLADEPYWPALTRLIDWAAENTTATIWSCLAAHAAVRHLDRVGRHLRPTKLCGLFDAVKAGEHPVLAGAPLRWPVPHSRCNELREGELTARGYRILARSAGAGVDMFVKRMPSLFLFLQGHPEYDGEALMREYRRDVGRYLAGERDDHPELPQSYFDDNASEVLLAFRERAVRERSPALLAEFPLAAARRNLTAPWRATSCRLYANWLGYLAEARLGVAEAGRYRPVAEPEPEWSPAYG
ncbi:MAG TPA: homoserine O-succinyltransferase [Stellaceae bacterium]|nr:homoserine O-succinyltransferase [Stellaceae bacterium]